MSVFIYLFMKIGKWDMCDKILSKKEWYENTISEFF